MSDKSRAALEAFSSGFNCAQAVLSVFAGELGLDREAALKIAGGFGGGMRRGEVCGAVTGALMVLGLKFGQCLPEDKEAKKLSYDKAAQLERLFEEENGSILCREILGLNLGIPEEYAKAEALGLFAAVCPRMIESAVRLAEDLLRTNRVHNFSKFMRH